LVVIGLPPLLLETGRAMLDILPSIALQGQFSLEKRAF
jgi:hypothetical protein